MGVSQLLIQARIGAFASAQWMARARLFPAEYKSRCPFCTTAGQGDDVEPETLAHILLRCSRWATERADMMIAPLLEELGADGTDDDKVLLLLGGEVNKEFRRFSIAMAGQHQGRDARVSCFTGSLRRLGWMLTSWPLVGEAVRELLAYARGQGQGRPRLVR